LDTHPAWRPPAKIGQTRLTKQPISDGKWPNIYKKYAKIDLSVVVVGKSILKNIKHKQLYNAI
jgi:hypothetical protein